MSYLNTVPLVWGIMKSPQRDLFELSFAVPSVCATRLKAGEADIGIVPVAALLEQQLEIFRGTGIACHGAVRTILLISKRPFAEIEVLAADSGSRTSVLLSRVILREVYGADPALVVMAPHLGEMLRDADAALIIGDAALAKDPDRLRSQGLLVADLGDEWMTMTGLPMVFAVWAGRKEVHTPLAEQAFIDSYRYGKQHMDEIVADAHGRLGVPVELARKYLTRDIVFELGATEYGGMQRFLAEASALPQAHYIQPATAASEK